MAWQTPPRACDHDPPREEPRLKDASVEVQPGEIGVSTVIS